MPNTLSVYDPLFYATEAISALMNQLGMARAVYRGYDANPQQRGSVINIPVPSTFAAADAPSTAQDITAGSVSITLNRWREVKFALTDKELTFTGEQIINDHIRPAAYALAQDIDVQLMTLAKGVPWYVDVTATAAVADVIAARKRLFDNKVPMDPARLFMAVDSDMEADLLGQSAFTQWQGSGPTGEAAQIAGYLGTRFGMNIFATQNAQTHTMGTASTGTLAVNGAAFAAGAKTINLDAVAVTGTLVPGDTFVIAGNTQRYVVTNTVTASGNAFTGVTFEPGLAAAPADDAVVTVSLDTHVAGVAFHRDAFALAMAPLTRMGSQLGAQIETVTDPASGISLRSRLYYEANSSAIHVALDCLYGVRVLDPNKAVRLRN